MSRRRVRHPQWNRDVIQHVVERLRSSNVQSVSSRVGSLCRLVGFVQARSVIHFQER